MNESGEGALLGLPESETDLDVRFYASMFSIKENLNVSFPSFIQNLTEYNTAHNRRISMLGITDDVKLKKNKNNKRKRRNVTFNDEECIINPEDVDPNVGRFRNLVQTTIVPTKRSRIENNFMGYSTSSDTMSASDLAKHLNPSSFMPHLYQDLPPTKSHDSATSHSSQNNLDLDISTSMVPSFGSKLGLLLPDPAPDVTPNQEKTIAATLTQFGMAQQSKCYFYFGFFSVSTDLN